MNIFLAAACDLFGIYAYLRIIYVPHSHQALKLECNNSLTRDGKRYERASIAMFGEKFKFACV